MLTTQKSDLREILSIYMNSATCFVAHSIHSYKIRTIEYVISIPYAIHKFHFSCSYILYMTI